jgi:S-DNA-T family DNA segregation ATPase FtsK/SpoIIIE
MHSMSNIKMTVLVGLNRVEAEQTLLERVHAPLGGAVPGNGADDSAVEIEAFTRKLAPPRLPTEGPTTSDDAQGTAVPDLVSMLHLHDLRGFDPTDRWRRRQRRDLLRVPLGLGADGRPVIIDLKQASEEGFGPHGQLVGAPGYGKSELLRTLVLSLALTHGPDSLNFVLIDFKGGATFAKLDRLPHTTAVITNLQNAHTLVDRMQDVLEGELDRRQERLHAVRLDAQRDYELAWQRGLSGAPMPSLLVICEEFGALLSAWPALAETFLQIGRVGRSLGVHMLLASQRAEEGHTQALNEFCSYRIALRTMSRADSLAVIGSSAAFEELRAPGQGFLRGSNADEPVWFRAAHVSAPYADADAETAVVAREASEYDWRAGPTVLDLVVDRLADRGPAASPIWLEPLGRSPTLDGLLGGLVADPERGLALEAPDPSRALAAVAGHVDKPRDGSQDPLWLDLSGDRGRDNLAVVGAARSGRSTLVCAVLASLALRHTPAELQIYGLDFGGGTLAMLDGLPHVGGVARVAEPDRVRRTVAEVRAVRADREARFAASGILGMADYRRQRASGEVTDDPFGDVFVVVDDWLTLRREFEDLAHDVTEFARSGLRYGIHVLVTAGAWTELRQRDLFGVQLELHQDAQAESIRPRGAGGMPARVPGRGITPDGYYFQGALPRLDGNRDPASPTAGMTDLVNQIRLCWPGPPAPAVRMLPTLLPYTPPAPVTEQMDQLQLPIGARESDLGPAFLDLAQNPHCLLIGDRRTGKTDFLRAFARSVTARFTPDQAKFIVISYGRTLRDVVPTSYILGGRYDRDAGYFTDQEALTGVMTGLTAGLRERRQRTGTDGATPSTRLFVLIDDYERLTMTAGLASNPLDQLTEFLADGTELGLHIVLARSARDPHRLMADRFATAIRNTGSPALVLSCPPGQGPIFEIRHPQTLPPGRAMMIDHHGQVDLVQLAWLDPALDDTRRPR